MTGTTQRVLVATDLTEASHAAVHFAATLAKAIGGSLELLHVVDMVGHQPLPEKTDPSVSVYLENLQRRVDQRVDAQAVGLEVERARCAATGIPAEARIIEGRVWEALLRRADETNPRFIVVGPHAKGPGERLFGALGERLWGTTADRVVRHARCPVWVIPAMETAAAEHPFARPMVALDFSSGSRQALALAAELARSAGGELNLVHVLPANYRGDSNSPSPADVDRAPSTIVANDAKARVHHVAQSLPDLRVHEEVRVAQRTIFEELAQAAADGHASCVIMGSHSHPVLDHVILGSTAERSAKRTTLPLLVVRG